MRTYKLTIAYDGSRYQGWQRQSNTDKTVQGLLEQAASETAGYPLEVQGSGRDPAVPMEVSMRRGRRPV